MPARPPELTPAEWEIMRVVWERGEAVVREVYEALAPSQGWAQTTVRTMMERLAHKGWLQQKKVGPVYLYKPAVGRGCAVRRTIRDLAERAVGGDLADLVAYAVGEGDVSDEELARLEELIRERREKQS